VCVSFVVVVFHCFLRACLTAQYRFCAFFCSSRALLLLEIPHKLSPWCLFLTAYFTYHKHTLTLHPDEEILKQGAIFFSPLMRVDSAAVMCSAALCNLAEVRAVFAYCFCCYSFQAHIEPLSLIIATPCTLPNRCRSAGRAWSAPGPSR